MKERIVRSLKRRVVERGVEYAINRSIDYLFPRFSIALDRLSVAFADPKPDDPTVLSENYKKLGIIGVSLMPSRYDVIDPENDIYLHKNDPVVYIGLPPIPRGQKSFASVSRSLELLAQYMQIHDVSAQYLIATTYSRLAAVSTRFGFLVADVEIPDLVKEYAKKEASVYRKAGLIREPIGDIHLIVQDKKAFIEMFGTKQSN